MGIGSLVQSDDDCGVHFIKFLSDALHKMLGDVKVPDVESSIINQLRGLVLAGHPICIDVANEVQKPNNSTVACLLCV